MKEQLAIQRVLRDRFEGLRMKNPSYSIRAFSRKAGISPATLSLILNGKRRVSQKLAGKISNQLLLDPQERSELLGQFPSRTQTGKLQKDDFYLRLTADQYQVIADWRAFAILGLTEIPGFKNNSQWIADRLGSSVLEVDQVIDRLKRLEMLAEDKRGNLKRAKTKYRTTDDVVNLSLRKSHHQTLELARESLERHSVEERDFSWITLPIDTQKIPEAKSLIRKFQDDFIALMEKSGKPNEVYRMAVQLIPLTSLKTKKEKT